VRIVERYDDEIKAKLGSKAVKVFSAGGSRFYECPLTAITRETADIISLVHTITGSGSLLHAGGWGEQPAWLVESIMLYRIEEQTEMKREYGRKKS
jgi:hypothetical protein